MSRRLLVTLKAMVMLLPYSVVSISLLIGGHSESAERWLVRSTSASPWQEGQSRATKGRLLVVAIFGVGLGLLAWLGLLLSGPNTVRNVLLYGLTDGGSTETSWGGPTLAGAWATHAAIALALLPVYFVIFTGILALQRRLLFRYIRGDRSERWAAPVAALLIGAGALFLVALIHQLSS